MRLNLDRQPKPENRLRWRRILSRAFLVGAGALIVLCLAPQLRAQSDPSGAVANSSNRFLFVVDISSAMKRHLPDVVKVVDEIVGSSASGQLRRGDTLGVWTFNQDVHSEFPLQTWDPNERNKIADRINGFLQSRPFAGAGRFDNALSEVFPIIRHSDVITVILLSDGKGKMKGTPFDQDINELYQQNLKESKTALIVTVLQGRGGKVFKYTVNALPWPVVIPVVPIAKAAPPPAPVVPPPVPQPAVAPLPVAPSVTPPAVFTQSQPPVNVPAPTPPPQVVPPVTGSYPPPPPSFIPNVTTVPPVEPPSMIPPPPPFAQPKAPPAEIAKALPPVVEKPPPPLVINLKPSSPANNAEVARAVPTPIATPPIVGTPTPAVAPANNPAPAPVLAAAKSQIADRPKILLIAGVILAVIGFILIILTMMRGREAPGPSLITRSMNNPRK